MCCGILLSLHPEVDWFKLSFDWISGYPGVLVSFAPWRLPQTTPPPNRIPLPPFRYHRVADNRSARCRLGPPSRETKGSRSADVASCISELRAELHAIKSVVAATPPPASAAASVWQMPPGTGSRHGSRSSRARSHDVPQPAFPIAPSVGRQPLAFRTVSNPSFPAF